MAHRGGMSPLNVGRGWGSRDRCFAVLGLDARLRISCRSEGNGSDAAAAAPVKCKCRKSLHCLNAHFSSFGARCGGCEGPGCTSCGGDARCSDHPSCAGATESEASNVEAPGARLTAADEDIGRAVSNSSVSMRGLLTSCGRPLVVEGLCARGDRTDPGSVAGWAGSSALLSVLISSARAVSGSGRCSSKRSMIPRRTRAVCGRVAAASCCVDRKSAVVAHEVRSTMTRSGNNRNLRPLLRFCNQLRVTVLHGQT